MNAETEDALDELMSLFPLRENRSAAFDEAVSKLAVLADPEAIPALLDLADETCQLSGLMHSLMESLEVYEADDYLPRFFAALPGFARKNPRLANTAVAKILSSPVYLELAKQTVPTLEAPVKRALRSVLLDVVAPEQERDQLLALL